MMSNQLEITTIELGSLQTNCYIVVCQETQECLIIDPADSGSTINTIILEQDLQPLGIIFTHGHFDHILGSLEVSLGFNIPIMMHRDDFFLVESAQDRASYWLKRSVDPVPKPKIWLRQGNIVPVGKQELLVLETPGHTPGSISLISLDPSRKEKTSQVAYPDEPIIFTGDTLFRNGVGRTDHRYSSPKALKSSLKKLFKLPGNTLCYPGHGSTTFLDSEKQIFD